MRRQRPCLVATAAACVCSVVLPAATAGGRTAIAHRRAQRSSDGPARIVPLLPGRRADGVWEPTDLWAGRPSPVLLTSFRFSKTDATAVAYAAWLRASRTQLALYPGVYGPGPTTLPRGPEQVPIGARHRLLATFNSGFYEQDAPAGFYVNGLLYHPMLRGLATVVGYRDGRVDVIRWRGGTRPGSQVVLARQNLGLFVRAGRPDPGLAHSTQWGNAPPVWRSGLGIDRNGSLVYLAAPNVTAANLASLLAHAGAVRAMELDINLIWPIFVTYARPGGRSPSLFVPNRTQIPSRFLSPSTKDFFAVYLRTAHTTPSQP